MPSPKSFAQIVVGFASQISLKLRNGQVNNDFNSKMQELYSKRPQAYMA